MMMRIGIGLALGTRRRPANQAPPGSPIPTASPVVSGTPQQGQTLSVTNGTWTNSPTGYTYQWRRNGTAISGATGNTYVLQAADVGANISCTVSATNANGTNYSNSNSVGPVTGANAAPVNTAAPVVSGTATEGQTLSTTNGTWTGSPTPTYTYQWRRGTTAISGATSQTYVLVSADVGSTINCLVTATNSQGSASQASNSVGPVAAAAAAPVNTAAPVISGTGTQGQTLTTTNGTWTGNPSPTYTYQWRRSGSAISGATGASYVLQAADVGATITCAVTGSNASGSATAVSNGIGPIAAAGQAAFMVDDFNRADDTGLAIGAPDKWEAVSGNTAALRVTSNQVQALAAEGAFRSLPDLGSANHATQCLCTGGTTVGPFIAVRLVDQNDFVGVRYNTSTMALQLWKRVGGTLTQIGTGTAPSAIIGSTLRVEAVGDQAQVTQNGVVVVSPQSLGGTNAGVTRGGLIGRTTAANPQWDNYRHEVITSLTT